MSSLSRTIGRRGYNNIVSNLNHISFTDQMQSLDFNLWYKTNETTGVIADNASYTGLPGNELFAGPNAASDNALEANATTGVSTSNATIASQNTSVYTGNYAISVVSTGTAGRGQLNISATRGRTYSFSIAARRGAQGAQQSLSISTAGINPAFSQSVTTSSFVEYTHTAIITPTTYQLRFVAGGTIGDEIIFDDVSIRETGQRDGFITGTVTLNQDAPSDLKSYDFSGGRIEAIGTQIDGLTNAEIILLINPDTFAANRRIIYKNGEWDIVLDGSGIVTATRTYNTTSASTIATTALQSGVWQVLRIQLNSETDIISIWIDDNNVTPVSPTVGVGTPSTNTNAWLFGSDGTNNYDGKLSNIAIKNELISNGRYINLVNAPDFLA